MYIDNQTPVPGIANKVAVIQDGSVIHIGNEVLYNGQVYNVTDIYKVKGQNKVEIHNDNSETLSVPSTVLSPNRGVKNESINMTKKISLSKLRVSPDNCQDLAIETAVEYLGIPEKEGYHAYQLNKDGIEFNCSYSPYYQQDENWRGYVDVEFDPNKFDKKVLATFLKALKEKFKKQINQFESLMKKSELTKIIREEIHAALTEIDTTQKYAVVATGGSIGDSKKNYVVQWNGTVIKLLDSAEEARQYALRLRQRRTPGEKSYYKMSFLVKKTTPAILAKLDLSESTLPLTEATPNEYYDKIDPITKKYGLICKQLRMQTKGMYNALTLEVNPADKYNTVKDKLTAELIEYLSKEYPNVFRQVQTVTPNKLVIIFKK